METCGSVTTPAMAWGMRPAVSGLLQPGRVPCSKSGAASRNVWNGLKGQIADRPPALFFLWTSPKFAWSGVLTSF